ncbi:APC family permease [Jonesia quinghaiensis]|uniref:APC family permease n=1 Tax=Jonesia quinghaiensis TaxID=262806 RepID=UPI000405AC0D|nr:amino acid permease [Jonesia quinghaiensis]
MTTPHLQRQLGFSASVFLGLGSMLGAGVFVVFGPATAVAGNLTYLALGIAAFIALCNALASAQLATQYPTSGGTYTYGRHQLGPLWGYLAGWGFLVGKSASCAAMAMTFAYYATPTLDHRYGGIAAVIGVGTLNIRGITRTATATRILVLGVLAILAGVLIVSILGPQATTVDSQLTDVSFMDVLQASGLLFFAFAGYARLATLGEEVKRPTYTIPRAIIVALGCVVLIYGLLLAASMRTLGADVLARSSAPLAEVVTTAGASWAVPVVSIGAALASLGALLALMTGIGRTALAMAREGDLPHPLANVGERFRTPYVADLVAMAVVAAIIVVSDVRGAIGFSAFGVLLYYSIANLSALRQHGEHQRYPRIFFVIGVVGCLTLMATLPQESVIGGVIVTACGALLFAGRHWLATRSKR